MSISREAVLETFRLSRERDTAVGLRLTKRENLLITTLEQVTGNSPETTVLIVSPETIYGEFLPNTHYPLSEIEHISLLRVRYNDPFYMNLRSLRSNIRMIRQEAGLEKRTTIS